MIFNKDDRIKQQLFRLPLLKPQEHKSETHPHVARAFKMQERRHFFPASHEDYRMVLWLIWSDAKIILFDVRINDRQDDFDKTAIRLFLN